MALALADHWLWDHWILTSDDHLDLFFLRASKALHDPRRRHYRATMGHARSTDGRTWELLPDALVAGDMPAFDDRATWTGCAVRLADGRIRLFYTGTSYQDENQRNVQRVSWADSTDGVTFHKTDVPPVEADPRWYEAASNTDGEVAWRDPFVYYADGLWHMIVCARLREEDEPNSQRRGVVGYATSTDCEHWEVQPPLSSASRYGHLECLQSREINGQWYLVFSCGHDRQDVQAAGTVWLAKGESAVGPWDLDGAQYVVPEQLYAGQMFQLPPTVVEPGTSGWAYTGFDCFDDNVFKGQMPDPILWENLELRSI